MPELVESRGLMMVHFLNEVKSGIENSWHGESRKEFQTNQIYRDEVLWEAIDAIHKQLKESHPDLASEMDEKQIAIELGYYVKHMSPFEVAEKYSQYNAIELGTVEHWFSNMCITCLGYSLQMADFEHKSGDDIFINYYKEHEEPSLRSVISLGEELFPIGESDFANVLGLSRQIVKEQIVIDGMPNNADWYWEEVGMDLIRSVAERGVKPFEQGDDGVSKISVDEYVEEWYWDIIASQFGWGVMDWSALAKWGVSNASLQDILTQIITHKIGQVIREPCSDLFPSDEVDDKWRRDNQ
jgi:hypothetical protein